MAKGSKFVVYAAFAGNVAIAAAKFAAFLVSGSTAMLTESVHSLVDTGNQALLMLGMKRAARPPDAMHPFGHGLEFYFWSFVVALLIFVSGAAVSIYQGVHQILHPEPIGHAWLSFAVLGVSAIFEGASFAVAYRQQKRRWPEIRLLPFIKRSKDPGLFVVLIEDSVALAGIAIAAVGVAVAVFFHFPQADGIASVTIGLLLVAVAAFLANETRSLLIGEAAVPAVVADVRRVLESDPRVVEVIEILSLHLGPEEILVGITIDFDDDLPGGALETAAQDLSEAVEACQPRITRVFLRPGKRAKSEEDQGKIAS
jgi:cation diffusion facilitator family transporter